ncbi:cytochrome c oxidase subunit 2A [Bacillus methanolicus]|nr:cytochrome c oxidase subunit 2A [Bacillus methanolicus]UQD52184.1 cytochrome c oxidase subunit 2A [Bacillus methanolicus]
MDNRTEDKEAAAYDERLKGTFVSVFFIGAAILLSWLIIFYLYTDKV